MISRADVASPARVARHGAATELTGSVLGGRHSGHAMFMIRPSGESWLRKGFSPQPIGHPSRESREASVPETVRARSGGGFSGNRRWHRDDQSSDCRPWSNVAVSRVMGRCGNSRLGFGCGSHMSPQVRSSPKATVECPLSLQHAEGRGSAPKGERLRVPRASFLEVSPRSSGKRTSLGKGSDRRRRLRPSGRPSEAARFRFSRPWLATSERRGSAPKGPASDCPGYGTTWQGVSLAGRVRDCEVRARVLIVKTDSRGRLRTGAPSSSFGNEEPARRPVNAARRRPVLCRR